jgi:hypothetical protein
VNRSTEDCFISACANWNTSNARRITVCARGRVAGIDRGRHEGSSIGFHQAYPRLTVQDIHALIADSRSQSGSAA